MEQTETKQFKRWFGDSKVVDRDGEPLVVYHGTGDDLTVFDPWKTNYGDVSEGYSFFTNKKNGYADSAQDYANRHKNGHVMETYLKIEKPLRLKSDGYFTPVHYYDENYLDIDVQFLSGDYEGSSLKTATRAWTTASFIWCRIRTRSRARRTMWGRSQISAILFPCAAMALQRRRSIPACAIFAPFPPKRRRSRAAIGSGGKKARPF